jgi:UDP:flavonoid glycosyltransferase YjiC (YdhE family)
MFVHQFSSWSHCVPMLAYGVELVQRGYRVSLGAFDSMVARVNQQKTLLEQHSDAMRRIDTVSLGSDPDMPEFFRRLGSVVLQHTPYSMSRMLGGVFDISWEAQFVALSRHVAARRPALMVCDVFAEACMDVARTNSIEYVVVHPSSVEHFGIDNPMYIPYWTLGPDTRLEHMSLVQRIESAVLLPLQWWWYMRDIDRAKNQLRAKYRVQPAHHRDLLVKRRIIIEDPWTLSHARAVPPTVHINGPTGNFSADAASMPPSLRKRLDDAERSKRAVVLVAMGSQARMRPDWIRNIVDGLRDALPGSALPPLILFSTIGNNATMFPRDSDTSLSMTWLPQKAILAHGATKLFVSHGGQASVFEAIYHNVPLLLLPLFGDQPRNAGTLADKHLALTLDKASFTADDVHHNAHRLLLPGSEFEVARAKYSRRFRLRNKVAAHYGADVIEEALHAGSEHLVYVLDRLPMWYLYHFDVAVLAVLVAIVTWRVLCVLLRMLLSCCRTTRSPTTRAKSKSE